MPLSLTPYTIPLLALTLFLAGFGFYIAWLGRNDPDRGIILSSALMTAGAWWVLTYTLRLSATTLAGKSFWLGWELVANFALPLIWLAYVLWYTDRTRFLSRRVFGPLALVSGCLLLASLTNSRHGLVLTDMALRQAGPVTVFDPDFGPLFVLSTAYAYTILLAAAGLLIQRLFDTSGVYRRQTAILILLGTLPGIATLVYVAGASPLPGLNIGVIANAITGFAGVIGIRRYNWLNTKPVGRSAAFEAMFEPALVVTSDGEIIDCNTQATALFDRDRAAMTGSRLGDRYPVLQQVLDGSTETNEQTVALDTPTSERVFRVAVSSVPAAAGAQPRVLVLQDLTEQKTTEQRLKLRSTMLERAGYVADQLGGAHTGDEVQTVVHEEVPDVFDADGAWLRPVDGQASERHSDFEPTPVEEPLLAQTAAAALETDSITTLDDMATKRSTAMTASAPADTPAGPADRATANTGERGQSCRYRSLLCVPVDDGLTLEVGAESPNVFGDADRQAGEILAAHLGTALDRVAVEKELRRERDRLDEFAGLVSHDLRNPLTVALGRLSLVRDRLDEPQVDTAYQALERMETLIEDLLTLARQDKTIDNPGPVALAAVAADARQTAAVDGATIEIADDLPTVEGDRSRLQQLFENCFRNAIDHNDPPVTVTVGSFSDGFFIADDGAGIPPDERTAVLESGYSSTAGGSGFGLAIVARIAEAHGWDVQITESEQGGARFEFVDDGAVD